MISGEPLPGMTQVMVNISEFRGGVLVDDSANYRVLVWFSFSLSGRRWAEKAWAKFKMNVPLFKGLFLRLYNARFARTAQMLLSAGVPMLEAMGIVGEAVNNIVFEDQIVQASTMVRSGKPLSVALKGREYILPLLPQMAATGEQSGKIDEMLGRAAQVL